MSQPWVILTRRTGQDVQSPTMAQLTEAIAELYHETLPGMTEEGYAEHGAASLRLGWDDGPMYVLDVDRLRDVTFEEWADQDYEHELAPPRIMRKLAEQAAFGSGRGWPRHRSSAYGHSHGTTRPDRAPG